jgi:hypothetical protein
MGQANSGTDNIYENNYIQDQPFNNTNCTFNYNAFTVDFTFPLGNNIGANNLMSQSQADTFTGGNISLTPSLLQLKPESPCKTAGTFGTEIGMYGGTRPYKASSLPFNPHIDKSVISTRTDAAGKLSVEIIVTAQEK